MWIFLPYGFFSAVSVRNDAQAVMVRARKRGHLVRLCMAMGRPSGDIVSTPKADYPYRIVVSKALWASTLADFIREALTYENFKDRAHQVKALDPRALLDVWSTMKRTEDPRSKPRS